MAHSRHANIKWVEGAGTPSQGKIHLLYCPTASSYNSAEGPAVCDTRHSPRSAAALLTRPPPLCGSDYFDRRGETSLAVPADIWGNGKPQ